LSEHTIHACLAQRIKFWLLFCIFEFYIMCFATPGQIKKIYDKDQIKFGLIDFGGETSEICLEYLLGIKIGDFIVAHKNFAIKKLSQKEADEMLHITDTCSH